MKHPEWFIFLLIAASVICGVFGYGKDADSLK